MSVLTVGELIVKLQELPPELRVGFYVSGEGIVCDSVKFPGAGATGVLIEVDQSCEEWDWR